MIQAMLSGRLLSRSPSAAAAAVRPFQSPFSSRNRNRSSRSGKLIEIDLDSALHSSTSSPSTSSSPSPSSFPGDGDAEFGGIGLRSLEESINCILALRYTPDWIPFLPGASFWVPPRAVSAVQYLSDLAAPFSEEESLSFASPRGWPCFDSLSQLDGASMKKIEVDTEGDSSRRRVVEIQVQVLTASEDSSDSGDDD